MTTKIIQIPDDEVNLFEQLAKKMGWIPKEERREGVIPYEFPRASIAVDMVVFGILPDVDELCVFVHRPKGEGRWWLSGGFMHCGKSFNDEVADDGDNWTLEETQMRALNRTWKVKVGGASVNGIVSEEPSEKTVTYTIKPNIDLICQLEVMSALNRDDRNIRVVSVPYMTLVSVRNNIPSEVPSDFAQWMPVSKLINKDFAEGEEKLAHDHFEILKNGLTRLFQEVRTRPIGGNIDIMVDDKLIEKYINKDDLADKEIVDKYFLLPTEFDVSQLIRIYSLVLQTMDVKIEKSNLLKRLMQKNSLDKKDKGLVEKNGDKCRFVKQKYVDYKRNLNFGFNPKLRDEDL